MPPQNRPSASDQLAAGTRLGPSLVVARHVGAGGMGSVYLAHDELLDRPVAVKLLHGQGGGVETVAMRTLLEARAAARVVHPHVAAVHAVGDHEGVPYIEMEWLEGRSLRAALRAGDLPGRGVRAGWLAQLAAALGHAHAAGVVHCDVKPENVLVLADGLRVKLVDFGLARSRADGSADRALSHGTLAYLAPELADAPPTAAADQFALAMLAVEVLTGDRPRRTDWTEAPQLAPTKALPLPAWVALQRGLAADPALRFATTPAFADALLRGLGLAHARGPLVGVVPGVEPSEHATSTELPVPALGLALPDLDRETLLLAALAVLPAGYPGALREALGETPPAEVLETLRSTGLVDGTGEDWRLTERCDREVLLGRLTSKQRRLLCARLAAVIEAVGPKRESVREDATRLYVAARRLADAARLALESATCARDALQRDHHFARAAALLASPVQPLPWLDALLQRCEWAVQCGWPATARGPLAEAQGVFADTRLPGHHPLRLRLDLIRADLLLLAGDHRRAHRLLEGVLAARPEGDDGAALVLLAHARLVDVVSRGGARTEALDRGRTVLQGLAPDGVRGHRDAWLTALGQLHSACGTAALRTSDLAAAESHYRRGLAIQQERGDELRSAGALVALGNVHFQRGDLRRAEQAYREAGAIVAPLGGIELTGVVQANLGDCWLRLEQPWPAVRALQRAQLLFEINGIVVHEREVLRLLAEALQAVGDAAGAEDCRTRAAALAAPGRR